MGGEVSCEPMCSEDPASTLRISSRGRAPTDRVRGPAHAIDVSVQHSLTLAADFSIPHAQPASPERVTVGTVVEDVSVDLDEEAAWDPVPGISLFPIEVFSEGSKGRVVIQGENPVLISVRNPEPSTLVGDGVVKSHDWDHGKLLWYTFEVHEAQPGPPEHRAHYELFVGLTTTSLARATDGHPCSRMGFGCRQQYSLRTETTRDRRREQTVVSPCRWDMGALVSGDLVGLGVVKDVLVLAVNEMVVCHLDGVDAALSWYPMLQVGGPLRQLVLRPGWCSSPPPVGVQAQLAKIFHPRRSPKSIITQRSVKLPVVAEVHAQGVGESEVDELIPFCGNCGQVMEWSNVFPEGYHRDEYRCEICDRDKTGARWFCKKCLEDICHGCGDDANSPIHARSPPAQRAAGPPPCPVPLDDAPPPDSSVDTGLDPAGRWKCTACSAVNVGMAPCCSRCQRQKGACDATAPAGGGPKVVEAVIVEDSVRGGSPFRAIFGPTDAKSRQDIRAQSASASICDGLGPLGTCDEVAVDAGKGEELAVRRQGRESICAF
mmetsp:Transcript_21863/g.49247  ORF Transcript_21863/g.49247 Transcript_21863/m.49247 type:complete len:546 (-) Transcript_21863:20-1657(-)